MMTTLSATILQKLEGQVHALGGTELRFVESDNGKPATWAGGEGFAVPVDVRNGGRHILKIFKLPTPERRRRARFLSTLALGSLRSLPLPLFAAAPIWPIQGILTVPDEGELDVTGHLAPFVHGRSFEELLMKGWNPPIEVRARLARQLCLAIEMLEGAGELVHGDLSPSNLMILQSEGPSPRLCLIDFDGFHHPAVPPVPVSTDRPGGRSWGTPGYRAPGFRRTADVVVDSDRVAMAILALELVVLHPDDADDLPGDTLLSQKDIDARSPRIPDAIAARWPDGWDLVREAIAATTAGKAPSPRIWRVALDRLERRSGMEPIPPSAAGAAGAADLAEPAHPTAPAFVVFVRQWGRDDRQVRLARPAGSFRPVSRDLAWLHYTLDGDLLRFSGRLPPQERSTRLEPLLIRHGGPRADFTLHDDAEVTATARFGDLVHWGDCDIYLA